MGDCTCCPSHDLGVSHCPSSRNGATQKPTRGIYVKICMSRANLLYKNRTRHDTLQHIPTKDIYCCFAIDWIRVCETSDRQRTKRLVNAFYVYMRPTLPASASCGFSATLHSSFLDDDAAKVTIIFYPPKKIMKKMTNSSFILLIRKKM